MAQQVMSLLKLSKGISKNAKMRRTLKCKIRLSPEDKQKALDCMRVYSSCCNELMNIAIKNRLFTRYKLHYLAYHNIRKKYNLSSQLVVTAMWKVIETLRSRYKNHSKTVPEFGIYSSVRLNYPRNFSIKWSEISFSIINGRVKTIVVGAYDKLRDEFLNGLWQITESHISYDKHKDIFYFNLGLKRETPQLRIIKNPIGIDLGIKRIAVTSTNNFFSNKRALYLKHKYDYLRSKLQQCGTKSAKRHLKKLAKRIRNFQKTVNHQISKQIVEHVKSIPESGIVFENLKNIRTNGSQFRKKQRKDQFRWSFRELQTFVAYKAEGTGVSVKYINPRGTSHQCSQCGSTNVTREGFEFTCHDCSYQLDADLNAARNIASRYISDAKAVCQPANRIGSYTS
ncbi:MAG: IS200/IS605 family element transposase accessory protein TnpB [Clostridia bacterium]|nr:IS200/IS605 family element transposase accessory protein TnpB [Clostridia bacterium]